MNWFIDFCALLKWFIIGGKKPVVVLNFMDMLVMKIFRTPGILEKSQTPEEIAS